MKKVLLAIIVTLSTIASFSQAKFQGSMVMGPGQNTLDIMIRPTANFTGYPTSIVFVVQVPVAATQPTFSTTSLSTYFTTFTTVTPVTDANFVSYYFSSSNSSFTTQTTITAGTAYPVLRLTMTGGNANMNSMRLAHLSGGGPGSLFQFYVEANAVTGGADDYTNYTQMFYGPVASLSAPLSDGAVGYATYQYMQLGALPIKWVSFSAQKQSSSAFLKWEVANQINMDYYEVEVGKDAQSLVAIGKISASDNKSVYTFTDPNLNKLQGQYAYYRIKQVDKDGKFTYSEVKKLLITAKDFALSIIGNPIKGSKLSLGIQSFENNKGTLKIVDLNGKQVYQSPLAWSLGYSQQTIDLPYLANGTYFANLIIGEEQYQVKFVK